MAKTPRKGKEGPSGGLDPEARASSVRWALLLAAVGVLAASSGRLRISPGRGRTLAVLSGGPLLLMLGALACGVLALISRVVQSLHQGANAREYESFRWLALWLGVAFAASSLIAHLYLGLRG